MTAFDDLVEREVERERKKSEESIKPALKKKELAQIEERSQQIREEAQRARLEDLAAKRLQLHQQNWGTIQAALDTMRNRGQALLEIADDYAAECEEKSAAAMNKYGGLRYKAYGFDNLGELTWRERYATGPILRVSDVIFKGGCVYWRGVRINLTDQSPQSFWSLRHNRGLIAVLEEIFLPKLKAAKIRGENSEFMKYVSDLAGYVLKLRGRAYLGRTTTYFEKGSDVEVFTHLDCRQQQQITECEHDSISCVAQRNGIGGFSVINPNNSKVVKELIKYSEWGYKLFPEPGERTSTGGGGGRTSW